MIRWAIMFLMTLAMPAIGSPGDSCSSDYSCGTGEACLKQQYQTTGTCATKVNGYGTQTYSPPSPGSVGPKMDDDNMCSFDTDCSIGFTCKKNGGIKGYCMR